MAAATGADVIGRVEYGTRQLSPGVSVFGAAEEKSVCITCGSNKVEGKGRRQLLV